MNIRTWIASTLITHFLLLSTTFVHAQGSPQVTIGQIQRADVSIEGVYPFLTFSPATLARPDDQSVLLTYDSRLETRRCRLPQSEFNKVFDPAQQFRLQIPSSQCVVSTQSGVGSIISGGDPAWNYQDPINGYPYLERNALQQNRQTQTSLIAVPFQVSGTPPVDVVFSTLQLEAKNEVFAPSTGPNPYGQRLLFQNALLPGVQVPLTNPSPSDCFYGKWNPTDPLRQCTGSLSLGIGLGVDVDLSFPPFQSALGEPLVNQGAILWPKQGYSTDSSGNQQASIGIQSPIAFLAQGSDLGFDPAVADLPFVCMTYVDHSTPSDPNAGPKLTCTLPETLGHPHSWFNHCGNGVWQGNLPAGFDRNQMFAFRNSPAPGGQCAANLFPLGNGRWARGGVHLSRIQVPNSPYRWAAVSWITQNLGGGNYFNALRLFLILPDQQLTSPFSWNTYVDLTTNSLPASQLPFQEPKIFDLTTNGNQYISSVGSGTLSFYVGGVNPNDGSFYHMQVTVQ